jgi:Tol biopolymer transport system component
MNTGLGSRETVTSKLREGKSEVTTQAMRRRTEGRDKAKGAIIASLALGAALAGLVALAGTAQRAEAALADKIVFTSNRAAGVDNPTHDYEIFTMNPDGSGLKQLTFNKGEDNEPTLSPDGTKIAYSNQSASDGQDGVEIFVMNTLDGSGKKNLTDNGASVDDYSPAFSPGGKRIAYTSIGAQGSNPDGDSEIYVMSALDGSNKKNLTNNTGAGDYIPAFSPDGTKIAYSSEGVQDSNAEGDTEVYVMNASDGSGQTNLTNNGDGITDYLASFSPDGKKIAYESSGDQTSNLEGDIEVYVMNGSDGSGQTNLTDNGLGINDSGPVFSPGGKKIAYYSEGVQNSNLGGDGEIYRMDALDGTGKKNLTNNGSGVFDLEPHFSADGTKVVYGSYGKQTSNSEGDGEIYRMNTLDGTGKKNLTNNRADDDLRVGYGAE